jgi:hypothetical protein
MKKYRASWSYSPSVDVFEIDKETNLTVSYRMSPAGRVMREAKVTDRHGWFDTFDEAKAALVSEFERKVRIEEDSLKRAKDRLGNAKGLRQEAETA